MSDLPSGTLTFIFTDVEGSTALLRRLRDAYGPVMSDHHRLLRATFGGAGGQEIDAQGDSLFYAFASPTDAVRAAVDAQRTISAHAWPEGVDLRVRIGIHTGEARLTEDGRYVGLAVHRAARICAAGHGGQTLLSQTTKSLFDAEEYAAADFAFVDLGAQPLKDFDRPVRIYQLTPTGLPDAFPPLRTLATGTAAGPPTEPGAQEAPVQSDNGSRLRVLIVDDQALVRTGFRMILEAEPDMEVVGESADGRQAIEDARRLRPDVVLMDVRMPQLDGIEATRRLLAEDDTVSKVVMLTTFDMDEYVYEALQAGASGFLLKDVPPEQLVSGIRAVCSGDALLAPSITRRVIEEFVRRPPESVRATPPEVEDLTEREVEVLRLIARGLSNAEIAKELYVSETTVKTHVARILMKLRLRDRVQVVVFAYESGLVQTRA
jgi:DNA-binding NarL/FixJ family response regulator/class 3 adenylate cyclase